MAEALVASTMSVSGWTVLERDWRRGSGEIDIIAFKDGILAFVEVKTIDAFGTESLAASVGPGKRGRIIETSKLFLSMHREFSSATVRYDVASVRSGAMADYYENAFAERT
jgi:putative endonuclease